jgi:hypothetical protein
MSNLIGEMVNTCSHRDCIFPYQMPLISILLAIMLLTTTCMTASIYTNIPKTDVQKILIAPSGQPNDTCTISEEEPNNECSCPPNQFAVGAKCNGRYCDDLTWTCASATDERGVRYSFVPAQVQSLAQRTTDNEPPIICPSYQVAVGVRCQGRYCDNMYLECAPVVPSPDQHNFDTTVEMGETEEQGCYWSPFFSEENQNWQQCSADGKWVRGLKCTGRYCDNLSLFCCPMLARIKPCRFTEWSEPKCVRLSFSATAGCGPKAGFWRYSRQVVEQNELGSCDQLTSKNDGPCDVNCNASPIVSIPPLSSDIPGITVNLFPNNQTVPARH